jgi:2-polyprenyl-6-methoxyphenol hydroxylase-like FAD-dependent oxidoreductase
MSGRIHGRAIVIGASIAGLATARVLAEHFGSVTILERGAIEADTRERRAVPQGHHVHTLLRGGQEALAAVFPELIDRLRAAGAVHFRVGVEGVIHCPSGPFYNFGCTVREPFDFGVELHNQSRGLLEQCIRELTLERPNVRLAPGTSVDGLLGNGERVTGVRIRGEDRPEPLEAELVVDAGGRGSQMPRWLEGLGLKAPPESSIDVDFAYASTKFRIPADYDEPYRLMIFHGPAPRYARAAAMLEIEDRTWHVSAAGRFDEKPPTDPEEFIRFVQSLPTPKLYKLIRNAERIEDIKAYRFPTSVRRHYDRLAAFPKGLLVIGDALCSVNPVYGQGMSTAALEAKALGALLQERAARGGGLDGLARKFFAVAAGIIDTPWSLAQAADFLHPRTTGRRPPFMALRTRYLDALNALSAEDSAVNHLMTEVFHLAKPVAALSTGRLKRRAAARIVTGYLTRKF